MLPKTRKNVEREMKHIWGSFRWLYQDKLTELDFMTRRMMAEMSSFGASKEMAAEFIQKEFARLWNEVAESEDEKYGTNGIRIGGG